MKTKYFAGALAVLALLIGAQTVQASTIFSYDFEGLSTGALAGQPGWSAAPTGYASPIVYSLTSGYDPSKVAGVQTLADWGGKVSAITTYTFATPLTFTSADTSIEQHIYGYIAAGTTQGAVRSGLMWQDQNYAVAVSIGMEDSPGLNGTYKLCFRSDDSVWTQTFGATVTAGDWYEIKAVMDFSHTTDGGWISFFYRDISLNQTSFTTDTALANLPMHIPQTAGVYKNAYGFRLWVYRPTTNYTVYEDNFSVVNTIPEPSTLMLTGMGLIGLLCYAWRKRK